MSDNLTVTISDLLRGVGFSLYLVLMAQVVYVIRKYLYLAKIERALGVPGAGLLATHVSLLGVALLGLGAQAIFITFLRIGMEPKIPTVTTSLFLGCACYGMYVIMNYERRRIHYHRVAKGELDA